MLHQIRFLLIWMLAVLVKRKEGVKVQSMNSRNEACNLLVAIDVDTVFSSKAPSNESITLAVQGYINELNKIYQKSILKNPPNHNMYFRLQDIWLLNNFVPNCENEGVVLKEFSKFDTSAYCLAHLLTNRDFGCVIGLAYLKGLCKKSGNTGFTKTNLTPKAKNQTIQTMAHEIGHNFGSDHDGGNLMPYKHCKGENSIMGGGGTEFSTCSIQAMQARIHQILGKDELRDHCFKIKASDSSVRVKLTRVDMVEKDISCPAVTRPDDECQDDNPDPPDPPEPPPEPVCGNGELEHPEECDCGPTREECSDPCCYPANITPDELALNASAVPCKRFVHFPCNQPYFSPVLYGLMYSWLFLLILFVITGLILFLDWKGRRYLYGHIIFHDEDIRINQQQPTSHRAAPPPPPPPVTRH